MKAQKQERGLRGRIQVLEAEKRVLERQAAEMKEKLDSAALRFSRYAEEKIRIQEERDRLWRMVQAINLISQI